MLWDGQRVLAHLRGGRGFLGPKLEERQVRKDREQPVQRP